MTPVPYRKSQPMKVIKILFALLVSNSAILIASEPQFINKLKGDAMVGNAKTALEKLSKNIIGRNVDTREKRFKKLDSILNNRKV